MKEMRQNHWADDQRENEKQRKEEQYGKMKRKEIEREISLIRQKSENNPRNENE